MYPCRLLQNIHDLVGQAEDSYPVVALFNLACDTFFVKVEASFIALWSSIPRSRRSRHDRSGLCGSNQTMPEPPSTGLLIESEQIRVLEVCDCPVCGCTH